MPDAYYVPADDGSFASTSATTSPWDASAQHGGPPSALLARAIETDLPRPDLAVARISIDFLGGLPQGQMEVSTEVLRPGRRVELVEARLTTGGRCVAVARAWRTQVAANPVPAVPPTPSVHSLPGAQEQRYFPGVDPEWGYGRSIDWRFESGSYYEYGPGVVWARPLIPLVADEPVSGLQRTLIVADSANGISCELDLAEWLFIPTNLTVTVHREPVGEWILLDARTVIDPRGSGMTRATLVDRVGEFGLAVQPLLVTAR